MAGNRADRNSNCQTPPGTENSAARLDRILAPIGAELPAGIAAKFLSEFGSIGGIVDASEGHLRRLLGGSNRMVDAFLVCRRLLIEGLRDEVRRVPLDANDSNLHRYLVAKIGSSRDEKVIAIFGNAQNEFITSELIAQGEKASITLSTRRLFSRALAIDSRSLILAHNHPSGSSEPSQQDISATPLIRRQAAELNIRLLDHIVVSRNSTTSMRERGLL